MGAADGEQQGGASAQKTQPDLQQQQQRVAEQQAKLEQFRRRTHDMYEAVAEKPLSVLSVRIEPHAASGEPDTELRTRQSILDRELQRVYDAKSLREVHTALEIAVEHLRQLEAFRRIDALIDDEPGVRFCWGGGWGAVFAGLWGAWGASPLRFQERRVQLLVHQPRDRHLTVNPHTANTHRTSPMPAAYSWTSRSAAGTPAASKPSCRWASDRMRKGPRWDPTGRLC